METNAERREQILDATEALLRRYGLEKTNLKDVGKALGITHSALYHYFPDKASLQEAVAERWLARVSAPLEEIVGQTRSPAAERIRKWLNTLAALKRQKVQSDPEMFATYQRLAETLEGLVDRHVAGLVDQLKRLIEQGQASGEFAAGQDPALMASVLLNGTLRYHHPHFVVAAAKVNAQQEAEFTRLVDVLIAGLRAGS